MIKISRLVIFIIALLPIALHAHSGGLDKAGCHNNKKTGEYHCHRKQTSSNNFKDSSKFNRSEFGYKSYKANTNIGFYTQKVCEKVHIDHVVSLKDAYVSGAKDWPNSLKKKFANDKENHMPACSSINMSKSASTPTEFLRKSKDGKGLDYEIKTFCSYVTTYFHIKQKYNLSNNNNQLNVLLLCD